MRLTLHLSLWEVGKQILDELGQEEGAWRVRLDFALSTGFAPGCW
jgi:hypothetical protein